MESTRRLSGLKAVCFDLGDTLLSLDGWWLAVCLAFGRTIKARFDLRASEAGIADLYQRAHTRMLLRLIRSDIEYLEAGIRRSAVKAVLKSLGLRFDQADVADIFRKALWEVAGADVLFPGAAGVIETVGRRCDLCLLSNGYGPWTRDFLRRQGLDRFFKEVVVSSDVGCQKPDPAIFQLALERLGTASRETAMVGDYYDTDIKGASAVGMRTVWLNPGHETRPGEPEADVVIEDIADVPAALGLDQTPV